VWGIGMQAHRRQFLQMAASATTLAALSGTGWALDYPTRPIHLIVGFPPGGAADLLSRLVGQALSERLGQQIVVENRAGASSNIATEFVVRAAPDGYTLLDVTSVNSWNAALFNNLKFDFIRDLVLVGGIYHSIGVRLSIRRSPLIRFPSLSLTLRPILASCAWPLAEWGLRSTSAASFSRRWLAWTCCTCLIGAAGQR